MTTPVSPFQFTTKSPKQVHDDYVRTIKAGLQGLGISNPNVGPGSDYDLQGWALGYSLGTIHANTVIANDQLMPDTAAGAFLDRWLTTFGLARNGAVQSTGLVSPAFQITSGYVNITTQQLTDASGNLFSVLVPGSYGPGGVAGSPALLQVPVISVLGGSAMNHANGDTLQWVTAPPFCGPAVTVGTTGGSDGLSGGVDSEVGVDEPPRQRLFSRLQNPPSGGNWSAVAGWALASTPDVQAAFVYPALLGPGSLFVAVQRAAQLSAPLSSTSKNRDLPAALIAGTVLPYVQGLVPSNMFTCVASVASTPGDVALTLSLPNAPTAVVAGPGGGWVDGSPWPQSQGSFSNVAGVTSSSVITVLAASAPTPGVTSVAWISPLTWQLYSAVVLTSTTVSPGVFLVSLSAPFPGIAAGNAIFPQAVQQQNYLAAMLQAFANMGPSEWTANATLLTRGFRHPTPGSAQTWPNAFDANFLRVMENAGQEVLSASFIQTTTPPSVPGVPTVNATTGALTSAAPYVFCPRNISWFQV